MNKTDSWAHGVMGFGFEEIVGPNIKKYLGF